MLRIALAGFTHEANSFCPLPTNRESFRARCLLAGEQIVAGARGTRTEQSGALEAFADEPGVTVVPLLLARAESGGPIESQPYTELRGELLERLRAEAPYDGVLLVLHGSMMAEGADDPEGELLDAVRKAVGPDVPVVATLDLHANVTVRMAAAATALVGYQTAPHVDMYETGDAAARILLRCVRGEVRPTPALVRLPLLVPAENARHTDGPLAPLIDHVRLLERDRKLVRGAVFAVQPWLDAPDVGCSVYIVTDGDAEAAARYATEIAGAFWDRRADFVPELLPPADAVRRALSGDERRVILCDSADSPSSGSTGDGTAVLKAVLDVIREIGASSRSGARALVNVVDAAAAAAATRLGVGERIRARLGGSLAPRYHEPVEVIATVETVSDGTFTFKGPGMRGVTHRMGPTAVLAAGEVRIVVTSRGVTQWDPELYRSVGLEPGQARLIHVKSPAAFRAGYEGLFDEVIVVDAPGASSPNLTALPWRRLGRPVYPLDPDASPDIVSRTWYRRDAS